MQKYPSRLPAAPPILKISERSLRTITPTDRHFMIDYQLRTRLVAGEHAIEQLGTLAKQLQAQRVLIVSDPGLVNAGIYALGA
jgi:hypothetical protein